MNHTALVCSSKARANLPGNFRGFIGREAADAADDGGKIFPIHVLHRQKQDSIRFADVEHAAHVGMRDLPRDPDLGVKTGQRGSVLRKLFREKFDGDNLSKLQIFGAIDFAHAATACQGHYTIPFGNDLTGREASSANWIRTG